jgi:hypothetical protein
VVPSSSPSSPEDIAALDSLLSSSSRARLDSHEPAVDANDLSVLEALEAEQLKHAGDTHHGRYAE